MLFSSICGGADFLNGLYSLLERGSVQISGKGMSASKLVLQVMSGHHFMAGKEIYKVLLNK